MVCIEQSINICIAIQVLKVDKLLIISPARVYNKIKIKFIPEQHSGICLSGFQCINLYSIYITMQSYAISIYIYQ